MTSKAATVAEYLASLPEDRRAAIAAVREVFLKNLDKDCREGMSYGMIGYAIPHSVYPAGYHCDPRQPLPFAGLASQKGHMSLYLMSLYLSPEHEAWFRRAWARSGKKLDMGKSCIRFKKIEDLPLDVIAEAVRRVPARAYIEQYERILRTRSKAPATKAAAGKPAKNKAGPGRSVAASKKAPVKKTGVKKAPAKKAGAKRR